MSRLQITGFMLGSFFLGAGSVFMLRIPSEEFRELYADYSALQRQHEDLKLQVTSERTVWQQNAEMLIYRHWEDSQQLQACLKELR